nr:short-chain dehydrogenase [Leptospira interrogans]
MENGLKVQKNCLNSHLITNYFATPLMIRNHADLILEITDGTDYRYRGSVYYTLVKCSIINLASSLSEELKPYGVTVISLTPGFLRSEAMLDYFGVLEENWKDAILKDPHFIAFGNHCLYRSCSRIFSRRSKCFPKNRKCYKYLETF